jgi:hypothetical protein
MLRVLMEVKSLFMLLPHLLFLSDELYVRLNDNSCEQNFAIYSSALKKNKSNSSAPGRGAQKRQNTVYHKHGRGKELFFRWIFHL